MGRATTRRLRGLVAATMLVAGVTIAGARHASGQNFLQSSPKGGDQYVEFETDRDAFTPSTTVTGESIGILEASYAFIDNPNTPDTNSWPELLALNLELGVRVGWGLTEEAARFFVDGGFGWRF